MHGTLGANSTLLTFGRVHKMPASPNVSWLALFSFLWGMVVSSPLGSWNPPSDAPTWTSEYLQHHGSQSYMVFLGEWGPCSAPELPDEDSGQDEYYIASRDHIDPASHVIHIIDSFVTVNGKTLKGKLEVKRKMNKPLKGLSFEPRVGEQTRVIECRDQLNAPVDMVNCLPPDEQHLLPSRVRSCIVSESCVVSEWDEWRPTAVPAQFRRTRSLISLPQGSGEKCGQLEEYKTLISNISDLAISWAGSSWAPCVVVADEADIEDRLLLHSDAQPAARDAAICGGGTQRRYVTCISTADGRAIPDHLCHHLQPIARVQRCEVQCPRDCQMSEWSDWGPCQPITGCPMSPVEELTSSGFRTRVRRVAVAPARGGAPCGALEAAQPCARFACERWRVGAWGACELPRDANGTTATGASTNCGDGVRERLVECVAPWGSPEPEWKCAGAGAARPAQREPCRRACPGDCVLGAWGDWSACSRACAGHAPDPPRRFRNRTLIARPKTGGYECPPPEQMHQSETCNEHACHSYTWLTLPWGPCLDENEDEKDDNVDSNPIRFIERSGDSNATKAKAAWSENSGDCGLGKQFRDVWCMEDYDRQVKDSHCAPIKKSEVVQKCKLPCPQDCILSDWGPWSDCPAHCTSEPATQVRRRYVVQSEARGGASCGAREQRRDCAPSRACRRAASGAGERAAAPRWAHGDWGACVLPKGVECGDGYITRAVWCSSRRHKMPASACAVPNGAGRVPPAHARCAVTCAPDARCALSDWSDWAPCPSACGHVSTRSRRKLEGSGQCAAGVVLHEGRECPCHRYRVQPLGEWSQCIINQHQDNPSESGKDCGRGTRFRAFACVDVDSGQRVDTHLCSQHHHNSQDEFSSTDTTSVPVSGLLTEVCNVPCPVDCQISRWGVWSPCGGQDNPPQCGIHIQTRTRNILVNESHGGRPCGSVLQSQVCVNPCDRYSWIAGPWLPCYVTTRNGIQRATSKLISDTKKGCGVGEQYRNIRCIDKSSGVTVQEPLCDYAIQPDRVQSCQLACPGDCVLSNWSEWSVCEQPCNMTKRRDRTRALLRAGAGNATCGSTVQAQPCIIDVTCYQYAWRIGSWSGCEPLGGSPCGEGIRKRPVFCQRSDGRQVDENYCRDKVRPNPTEKFCYVECPIDCSLSEWSEWLKDSCSCGTQDRLSKIEFMTRNRYILTVASSAGRPCPNSTHLREMIPCPREPCHSVKISPSSDCELDYPGASCGYGKRRHEVKCVRDTDGADVPSWYCDMEALPTEESCFVECSSGCRASAWGVWSGCDAEGVRYRKRVSYRPPGPPCVENFLRYEVFEYANCNVTESELNKDSEWSTYEGDEDQSAGENQDDYYVHISDQPEKTYLLFRGKRLPDEHAALIAGLSCAVLVALLLVLYAIVRYHKRKTAHKV